MLDRSRLAVSGLAEGRAAYNIAASVGPIVVALIGLLVGLTHTL